MFPEDDEDPIIQDEDLEPEDDLEIDLDDDEDEEPEDDKKSPSNQKFAAMRVENKKLTDSVETLTQQVSDLQNRSAAPATPAAPAPSNDVSGIPRTDEEWDDLADKDWKKAVDLRSIQNAQNIMKQQQAASKADTTLAESKQKVLAVHPELNDNNSEKAKIYLNILNDNPDYLTQPKGPIYAMRDMEDYMEHTLGYKRKDIRSAESAGVKKEAERQNRIVLNKGGGRANEGASNKVVISKDELEFCKFQGIDPKEFAKNKKKLSKSGKTEGVSV